MGLLDDAIREHLELKRKHGAPDAEVSAQEAEALGPARRDVPVAEVPLEEPGAVAASEFDPTPETEPTQMLPPAEAPAPPPEAPFGMPDAEFPPVEEPPVEPPPVEEPEIEPPPVEPPPVEPPLDPGPGQGTTPPHGFPSVEDEPAAAEQQGEDDSDDDVLEETPDFLQESPEHDRLWFEQKPPRDFDFD